MVVIPGELSSQKDTAAPHFHIAVRDLTDKNWMKAETGKARPIPCLLDPWTLLHRTSTYVKDQVYQSLTLQSIWEQILHAMANVNES